MPAHHSPTNFGSNLMFSPAIRLSLFFALYYSAYGVITPFWPVWLAHRGLSPDYIGATFAAGMIAKTVGIPAITALADRLGKRRVLVITLMSVAVASTLVLAFVSARLPILIFSAILTGAGAGCVALVDNITLLRARVEGFAYSQVRMWGSVSWLVVSLSFGAMLPIFGPEGIVWVVLIGSCAGLAAAFALPEAVANSAVTGPAVRGNWLQLLTHPPLVRIYIATALLQNAHIFYYAFGTIHWQKSGLSDPLIGWLWTEGVIAEVLLFALAPRFAVMRRPNVLFATAIGAGIIRWITLASTTDPTALVLVNFLHAFTFGACHLAAMIELTDKAPPGLSASAQGVYAAFSGGLASAAIFALSGPLYTWAGHWGYLSSLAMTLIGGAVLFYRPKTPYAPQ